VKTALVLSCEHATDAVPARYRDAFGSADAAQALASHRGSDLGARALARQLARTLRAPLHEATTSRLLADANRSLGHPALFSEWSRALPDAERQSIVQRYWGPHRDAVEQTVADTIAAGERALHVSVHSFTPHWHGRARAVDVAWLYDPKREPERAFVDAWRARLAASSPRLRLRRNHPYRGDADGLTTSLRRRFPADRYLGIELEVSQRFPLGNVGEWRGLRAALTATLAECLLTEHAA